jgi:luciferase-type oxidoreductase
MTGPPGSRAAGLDLLGTAQKPFAEHPGMARAFPGGGRMTVGAICPVEGYRGAVPTMADHAEHVLQAERAGFASVWVRDVPLLDPDFGDAGQVLDPWVYLGHLAAITSSVTLGTASAVLPLRHPLDIAKAAASMDQLTGGRFLLGVATGDRQIEFPAYGLNPQDRGERFRESLTYFRTVLENHFPTVRSPLGRMDGAVDLLPKPLYSRIPVLMTGHGRQEMDWIAENTDGWLYYTPPFEQQRINIANWRTLTSRDGREPPKPFAQATYLDLDPDPKAAPLPIHQGFAVGRETFLQMMLLWQELGIDQLMINFKYSRRPVSEVLDELGEYVLPHFPPG